MTIIKFSHKKTFCLVFVMLSCLLIAALWSPVGKGLTSWLLFVIFNCLFVTFPCGILGQVWYLIVSITDLCPLFYFAPPVLLNIFKTILPKFHRKNSINKKVTTV